jgi:hypothetical protein
MRITLCGSTRYEKLFHYWNEKLTLAGHVVYGLAVYPSSKQEVKDWYTEDQKTMLDLVHFAKIDNSDAIVVLNQGGYIGISTAREIKWATLKNKGVFYIETTIPQTSATILA